MEASSDMSCAFQVAEEIFELREESDARVRSFENRTFKDSST
jgi:hypothetical protein